MTKWNFSGVIGIFIQIIFKYLTKWKHFSKMHFLFKLKLPLAHMFFCLSHLYAFQKGLLKRENSKIKIKGPLRTGLESKIPGKPWSTLWIWVWTLKDQFEEVLGKRIWIIPSVIDGITLVWLVIMSWGGFAKGIVPRIALNFKLDRWIARTTGLKQKITSKFCQVLLEHFEYCIP